MKKAQFKRVYTIVRFDQEGRFAGVVATRKEYDDARELKDILDDVIQGGFNYEIFLNDIS